MSTPPNPNNPYGQPGQHYGYPPHGPYAPHPVRPPRRKKSPRFWVLFAVGLTAAVIGAAWVLSVLVAQVTKPSSPQLVLYEITGSAVSASLDATSGTGSEQYAKQPVPTTLRYLMDPGHLVYVSAQNDGASGDVTCTIRVGSQVISQNSASGAYAIAVCHGSLPY